MTRADDFMPAGGLPAIEGADALDTGLPLDQLVHDGLQPSPLAQAPAARGAPMGDGRRDPADAPLEALHEDYLRALADPHHGGGGAAWSVQTGDSQGVLSDEFERLQADAADKASLYDVLGPQPELDALLAGMDPGAMPDDPLAPEVPASVLHLLAPVHLRRPEGAGELLELLAPSVLPGLTRKEHHDVALDSAIGSLLAFPPVPAAGEPEPGR